MPAVTCEGDASGNVEDQLLNVHTGGQIDLCFARDEDDLTGLRLR